jgi:hypothetical protein
MQLVQIWLKDGTSKNFKINFFPNSILILFFKRLCKKDPNSASIIFTALEDKITFVLLLLSHSDDDISESVSDYCQNYIILLKHIKIQNEIQKKHIEVFSLNNSTKTLSIYLIFLREY